MNYLNLPQRVTGGRATRILGEFRPQSGITNVLSFKDVRFIDPFGLIIAAEYLRYLVFAAEQVAIYLPQDGEVLRYLRRSRFVEFATQLGRVLPESKAFYPKHQDEDWLLPLTPLRSEEEVPGLVARLYSSLQKLMERSQIMAPGQAAQMSSLLAELCQNVTQHSFDLGLVAAQVYRTLGSQGEKRTIQIAVGDLGIGLRGSLAKRYMTVEWSDAKVISQALAKGVSSVAQEGRGLGLALVYQKTSEFKGHILIRSGTALLESKAATDLFTQGAYFPGTQIALEF
ncbi:MAG: ATP-binding protein [Symbiobacteriaceae bacterium]|nr:ATP-binding protein [Symbiobacteriaceae bacterium]